MNKHTALELRNVLGATVLAFAALGTAHAQTASPAAFPAIKQIDAGIFFDSSAGNDQNTSHFYWDIAMYTSGAGSPIPTSFMLNWYAGPDGSNISQKSNGWAGVNSSRWVNADYDAAFDELGKVTTFEEANTLLIKMNDIVIDNVALIPQVNRAAAKSAIINTLVSDNVAASAFEPYEYWNMANWTRTS